MITTKQSLQQCLRLERELYFGSGRLAVWKGRLAASKFGAVWRFQRVLRLAEYHKNNTGFGHRLLFFGYHRKKNRLGLRLGFEIPENCVEEGLMIYHIAPIVINEDARIGKNCRITGELCVGNTGPDTPSPRIGRDVRFGWGCTVIGGIRIADGVTVGAGAVVTRDIDAQGAAAAGVPAVSWVRRNKE